MPTRARTASGSVRTSKPSTRGRALGRADERGEQPDGRGLARAVGPEQAEHLATPDIERDVADRPALAEASTQPDGMEGDRGSARPEGVGAGRRRHRHEVWRTRDGRAPLPLARMDTDRSTRPVIALHVLVTSLGVALGVIFPFISVILADFGFSPGEIGFISSLGRRRLHHRRARLGAPGRCPAGPAAHPAAVRSGRRRGHRWPCSCPCRRCSSWSCSCCSGSSSRPGSRCPTPSRSTPCAAATTPGCACSRAWASRSRSSWPASSTTGPGTPRPSWSSGATALVMVLAASALPDVARADLDAHRRDGRCARGRRAGARPAHVQLRLERGGHARRAAARPGPAGQRPAPLRDHQRLHLPVPAHRGARWIAGRHRAGVGRRRPGPRCRRC